MLTTGPIRLAPPENPCNNKNGMLEPLRVSLRFYTQRIYHATHFAMSKNVPNHFPAFTRKPL